MSYDLSDRIAAVRSADGAFNVLEADLIAEKASSLGHQGQLVEKAMAALKACDPATGDPEGRLKLVKNAAREVWAFLVQRELCGLRDQKQVVKDYGIPGEVLARLGAIEK
ncbi:MAG: DUF6665 family protein [Devosia sp.]